MTPEETALIQKCLHDMNNALVAISGLAELMVEDVNKGREKEFAKHILEATAHISKKLHEVKNKINEKSD